MKLSIITINLNNREGFRKTAESVICQTFTDYEWIVIDGGSNDGSKELIEHYSEHISYWVSEPDKGIYNAMNKGIKVAMGEYCLFLNSGDYLIDGGVLKKVFDISFTEDVVYCSFYCDKGGLVSLYRPPRELTLGSFVNGNIQHSGATFFRLNAFDQWGLYDENLQIVSDWKWFLVAIGLGTASTRFIDIILSVIDETGVSRTKPDMVHKETEAVLSSLIPDRIRKDYNKMYYYKDELYKQEIKIRNSAAYRLGSTILLPLKLIQRLINNSIFRKSPRKINSM